MYCHIEHSVGFSLWKKDYFLILHFIWCDFGVLVRAASHSEMSGMGYMLTNCILHLAVEITLMTLPVHRFIDLIQFLGRLVNRSIEVWEHNVCKLYALLLKFCSQLLGVGDITLAHNIFFGLAILCCYGTHICCFGSNFGGMPPKIYPFWYPLALGSHAHYNSHAVGSY